MVPRVSVIVPCHGDSPYLEEALSSIHQQTYKDIEIVLVSDGGPESARATAVRFGAKFLETRAGNIGIARSVGLAEATGEYVALLDCDNLLFPDFLQRHLDALAYNSSAAWAYSDPQIYRESHADTSWFRWGTGVKKVAGFDRARLAVSNYIDACTVIRRSALRMMGDRFPVEPFMEDYALWLSLVELGWSAVHIPQTLFLYRVHGNNMSRDRISAQGEVRAQAASVASLHDSVPDRIRGDHQRRHPVWQRYRSAGGIGCTWSALTVRDAHTIDAVLEVYPHGCYPIIQSRVVLSSSDDFSLGRVSFEHSHSWVISICPEGESRNTAIGAFDLSAEFERGVESCRLYVEIAIGPSRRRGELYATPSWLGTWGVEASTAVCVPLLVA